MKLFTQEDALDMKVMEEGWDKMYNGIRGFTNARDDAELWPLCFRYIEKRCKGCPVNAITGAPLCRNIKPLRVFEEHMYAEKGIDITIVYHTDDLYDTSTLALVNEVWHFMATLTYIIGENLRD